MESSIAMVPDEVTAEKPRTIVILGNGAPVHQVTDADGNRAGVPHPFLKQSETRVDMWSGFDDPDNVALTASTNNDRIFSMIYRSLPDEYKIYAIGVSEIEQLWSIHSGNSNPDWVYSSDSNFAHAISSHFGCPVANQPPSMLLTSAGRDALHQQHMSTSAQPASFNYMALTATTTAPASGDTTLAGEITTTSGGLIRKQATFAHTTGTNTSTLTATFTANGSDSLPVVIAQIGIFNAATTGGTIAYHTALSTTATLSAVGDNLTVTETVTGG